MTRREVPAEVVIIRHLPDGGVQGICACADHKARTIAELGSGGDLEVRPADPSVHGCKGCLEDWQVT